MQAKIKFWPDTGNLDICVIPESEADLPLVIAAMQTKMKENGDEKWLELIFSLKKPSPAKADA